MTEPRNQEHAGDRPACRNADHSDRLWHAERMRAVGQLASSVAHDFNNLLTTILGNGDLLLSELDEGSETWKAARQILLAAERASELTARIRAFSRRDAPRRRLLCPREAVEDFLPLLTRLIGPGIEVRTSFPPAPWRILADAGRLHQVLLNLCVNARDAMPRGGRLSVRIANRSLQSPLEAGPDAVPAGDWCVLEIADTGQGMDATTLQRIFDPFFTTKRPEQGTGLGLATVRSIVRQEMARITAESGEGSGSTFRVWLPRQEREEEGPAKAPAKEKPHQRTVMVVEDDEALRQLLRSALREQGYRVLEAVNGRSALELARYIGPYLDLLVTDVVMPEMDGARLASRLRQHQPGLQVLFITAYADDTAVSRLLASRRGHLLEKPFATRLFLERVEEITQGELALEQEEA